MEIESSVFCITCNGLNKGDLSISAIRVETRGSVLLCSRLRANEADGASRCRENRSLPQGCARPALATVRRRDRRETTGGAPPTVRRFPVLQSAVRWSSLATQTHRRTKSTPAALSAIVVGLRGAISFSEACAGRAFRSFAGRAGFPYA